MFTLAGSRRAVGPDGKVGGREASVRPWPRSGRTRAGMMVGMTEDHGLERPRLSTLQGTIF